MDRLDALQVLHGDEAGPAEGWIFGDRLWSVGFTEKGLPLVTLMSGLVEIYDTFWDRSQKVLVFIVRSLDSSGTLFTNGTLRATPLEGYKKRDQSVLAQS